MNKKQDMLTLMLAIECLDKLFRLSDTSKAYFCQIEGEEYL